MKYISIDLETTGVDADNSQILSIGAIIEDTDLKLEYDKIPKFHAVIKRKEISGNVFAINLNSNLIRIINDYNCLGTDEDRRMFEDLHNINFYSESEIVNALYLFCLNNGLNDLSKTVYTYNSTYDTTGIFFTSPLSPMSINCAGKNFGTFDKLFLEKLPNWDKYFKIRQRVIDPSVFFTDWTNDNSLPNLETCKSRANLNPEVTHNAIEDAWDVITLLRTQY